MSLRMLLCGAGEAAQVEFLASNQDEFFGHLKQARAEDAASPDACLLFLWHRGQWWNLFADLPAYCWWRVRDGQASRDAVLQFFQHPLSRPDWLYEAAAQMAQVLTAADQALHRAASPEYC